jgi:hypothetical protein
MPERGGDLHPLATYKGRAVTVGGRPLVALLVERLLASGRFGPVTIAGPRRVYEDLELEARIVDTDASVARNLRAAIEAQASACGGPLAVLACDVLPSAAELGELAAQYEAAGPAALWFPLVRLPADRRELGAFAWKPEYEVVLASGEAVRILPGHLGIIDPSALRLPLLYQLLDLAYRTRNRSVPYRRAVMLRTVLFSLLAQDFGRAGSLRVPDRTVTIVGSGLKLARELHRGRLEVAELERLIARIFLRESRGAAPHAVRYPVVDMVSLAEDVDTEEEARAIQGEVRTL